MKPTDLFSSRLAGIKRICCFSFPNCLLAFFAAALISSAALAEEQWEVSWDLPADCNIGVYNREQKKNEQLPRQGSLQFSESEFVTINVSWKRDYESIAVSIGDEDGFQLKTGTGFRSRLRTENGWGDFNWDGNQAYRRHYVGYNEESDAVEYLVFLGEKSAAFFSGGADYSSQKVSHIDKVDRLIRNHFKFKPGTATEPAPEWRQVSGEESTGTPGGEGSGKKALAAAAVAAAAAAIAAAYWRRRRASGDKSDKPPEGPIGYILQVSNNRLDLEVGKNVGLTAAVWEVDYKGCAKPAAGASLQLHVPQGLQASQTTGQTRLTTHLNCLDNTPPGSHSVTVTAQAGGSSYQAQIAVTVSNAQPFAISLNPRTLNLQQDGRESILAKVIVTGPQTPEALAIADKLTAGITFTLSGNCRSWFALQEAPAGDSRQCNLDLTIPDDAAKQPGPNLATLTATVSGPQGPLSAACAIAVTLAKGFELRMDRQLTLRANDVAGSLLCCIVSTDSGNEKADEIIRKATPDIQLKLAGPQAIWLREEDGPAGELRGQISGSATPGKEAHPLAEAPLAELSAQPPYAATITASVTIPKFGSFTQVSQVEITPPEWFIEAKVVKQEFVLDGKDSAEFQARLIPQQQHKITLYGGEEHNALNRLLEFKVIGENAGNAKLTEKDGEPGYRTFAVSLSPECKELPADFIDIEITATLTGSTLNQNLRINLINKPVLKVSCDAVSLLAGGDATTLTAEVEYPGIEEWEISAELKDIDAVSLDGPDPIAKNKVSLSLTPATLTDDVVRLQGTLEVFATSKTQSLDPLKVTILIQDEGLQLLTDPATVFTDPKIQKPGLVKLQVVRWQAEEKRFLLDRKAMQTGIDFGEFTPGDYLNGEKIFKGAGVHADFLWLNGSGMEEYAAYKVLPNVLVPGDATPIDARWEVRAPGDGDKFTRQLKIRFPADPLLAANLQLAKEIENCKKMINFLPEDKRGKWQEKILAKDAPLIGYKGLYKMRHDIWDEARQCLMREAQDYLDEASYNDRIVTLLEWAQWVNELAWQAVSSLVVPFPPANIALSQVRSFLTEYCAAACNEGTPIDVFAKQYLAQLWEGAPELLADTAIGFIVDLDNIAEKLLARYPTNPVKAFSLACVVVWIAGFVQFLSYKKNPETKSPYSIPEAAWEATKALRDQIIVSALCKDWEAKHGAHQNGDSKTPNKNKEDGPQTKQTGKDPSKETGQENGGKNKGDQNGSKQETPNKESGKESTDKESANKEPAGKTRETGKEGQESDGTSTRDDSSPQEPSDREPTNKEHGRSEPDGSKQETDSSGQDRESPSQRGDKDGTSRKPDETSSADKDGASKDRQSDEGESKTTPDKTREPGNKEPANKDSVNKEPTKQDKSSRQDEGAQPNKGDSADKSKTADPANAPRKNPEPGSVARPDKPQKPEQHLDRFRDKPPSRTERENAWHEGKQEGKAIVDQAKEAAKSGDPQKLRDATLEMQANKQGIWDINRQKGSESADTRTKLNNEIKQIYDKTDGKVCNELGKKYGEGVRPKSITNEPKPGSPPKDPSKMSIDRDVTYERPAKKGELIPDPKTQGKFTEAKGGEYVDIPAKESSKVYAEKFKETALEGASQQTRDKYKDMSPEKFTKRMDQTVTDRVASDAYGRGPSDLNTAVKDPAGEFSDPSGVGQTSEFKANEWYEKAEREATTHEEHETYVAEGMRQTTKQYGNQIQNRLDILNQNRGPGSSHPELPPVTPPPELKAGIDIIKQVSDGKMSPATADARLAAIGMTRQDVGHSLNGFLNKIYRMPVNP